MPSSITLASSGVIAIPAVADLVHEDRRGRPTCDRPVVGALDVALLAADGGRRR